jgi:N-glycosylase/DNA lyase
MVEFKELGNGNAQTLFNELCFCLLTANYTAEGGIRIQKAIGNGFISLSEKQLAEKLKQLGYRFPNTRAKYIVEARKHTSMLVWAAKECENEFESRDWLVDNVKGLGYKEASHFLRNIGKDDVAIIDFHIIDLLVSNCLIKKPKSKTLNAKRYLEIEEKLKQLAAAVNLSLGELDLYLWYIETGKVMK